MRPRDGAGTVLSQSNWNMTLMVAFLSSYYTALLCGKKVAREMVIFQFRHAGTMKRQTIIRRKTYTGRQRGEESAGIGFGRHRLMAT
jgi:hypothetical protein